MHALAAHHGCHVRTVRRHIDALRDVDLVRPRATAMAYDDPHPPLLATARTRRALRLLRRGAMTYDELADECGLTVEGATRTVAWLRRLDLVAPANLVWSSETLRAPRMSS